MVPKLRVNVGAKPGYEHWNLLGQHVADPDVDFGTVHTRKTIKAEAADIERHGVAEQKQAVHHPVQPVNSQRSPIPSNTQQACNTQPRPAETAAAVAAEPVLGY